MEDFDIPNDTFARGLGTALERGYGKEDQVAGKRIVRKVKVAEHTQIAYRDKVYEGGRTISGLTEDDQELVGVWLRHGWAEVTDEEPKK